MTPKLYSKSAVISTCVLLSPILGSILFSNNLKQIGNRTLGPILILLSILWIILIRKVTFNITTNGLVQLYIAIANVSFSFILLFLWNTLVKSNVYETKPAFKPIIIFLLICAGLIIFQLLATPK
jgi:hypothetical protein